MRPELRGRAQPVREHVELLEAGADDVAVRRARAVGQLLAGLGEDGVAAELAGSLDADREQRALRAAASVLGVRAGEAEVGGGTAGKSIDDVESGGRRGLPSSASASQQCQPGWPGSAAQIGASPSGMP